MSSSDVDRQTPLATKVSVTDDSLCVELSDGRTITAPLIWFPRLTHATARERKNWRLTGRGLGIHWPDVDEDISVANLVMGRASGESQESLAKWLATRQKATPHPRRAET